MIEKGFDQPGEPKALRIKAQAGRKLQEVYMPRYLIVNADDFGRSPGVNRGIIKAYREGIVSSTSVMTNQPYFEEAASLLRDHPSLGAGVHLVFTAWKPVLPPEKIPSLVDEKGFFLPQEALLAQPGRVDR
ncbi:MAG TPA: ChbG/HpnK family deacetylase, partial [Chloroflexi bacterium]|nr:ChbG/HpnK family deacetylase [Chloroflexota bacterium]